MTSLFAIFFFLLTQLTVEQELAEKYCPPENEVKPSCPRCAAIPNSKFDISESLTTRELYNS